MTFWAALLNFQFYMRHWTFFSAHIIQSLEREKKVHESPAEEQSQTIFYQQIRSSISPKSSTRNFLVNFFLKSWSYFYLPTSFYELSSYNLRSWENRETESTNSEEERIIKLIIFRFSSSTRNLSYLSWEETTKISFWRSKRNFHFNLIWIQMRARKVEKFQWREFDDKQQLFLR